MKIVKSIKRFLVKNLKIKFFDFELLKELYTTFNRSRTEQDKYIYNLFK